MQSLLQLRNLQRSSICWLASEIKLTGFSMILSIPIQLFFSPHTISAVLHCLQTALPKWEMPSPAVDLTLVMPALPMQHPMGPRSPEPR